MDKNTITGFILIAAVLIGFSYFSRPSEAELRQRYIQDSIAVAEQQKETARQKEKEALELLKEAEAAMDTNSLFHSSRMGESQPVILQNELVKLTLSTRGGCIEEAELKEYKSRAGGNVILFDKQDASMKLMLTGKNENIVSSNFFFTPVHASDSAVTMRLAAANGGSLDFQYKLRPHSYMVDFTVTAHGLSHLFAPSLKTIDIEWMEKARQQEKGFDFENRYSALTYKIKNEGSDNLSETGEKQENISDPLDWIAFKNQFFSCVFIAHQDFTGTSLASTPQSQASGYLKLYEANMQTFFDPNGNTPTQMQLYFGPNNYHLLQQTNELSLSDKELDLEDLVLSLIHI